MAITNDDFKLFDSQRLSDEEDGEGWATGRKVIDDNANNLFQDISRIDRTVRDVVLRKAFVGISTDNNDTWQKLKKLGSGVSLCRYLVYHHKRQVLCKMKVLTVIFSGMDR